MIALRIAALFAAHRAAHAALRAVDFVERNLARKLIIARAKSRGYM